MSYDDSVISIPTNPEWYDALVEECKAIITEASFNSRWALVEGYHALGERIIADSEKMSIERLVMDLAGSLNRAERSLWYAVKFARQFPRLDELPEGKDISWRQIVHKHLTGQVTEEVHHVHRLERQVWNVCAEEGCYFKERIE